MNDFLNEAVRQSLAEEGREKVVYEHLHETDFAYTLSDAGYDALPQSVINAIGRGNRKLRLRKTIYTKTGGQKALIVKVPLGNLHIFNPRDSYDMRISINFECDFSRHPNPQLLSKEPLTGPPPQAGRVKDRLSYKHLGMYQADLTKVETTGLPPKYELELELAAGPLRQQLSQAAAGQEHCYTDMIEGFVDNANLLMRQRRKPPS